MTVRLESVAFTSGDETTSIEARRFLATHLTLDVLAEAARGRCRWSGPRIDRR